MTNYLMHHGTIGQKWGIRRYQNEDGSLTQAGYERYFGKTRSELSERQRNKLEKKDMRWMQSKEKKITRDVEKASKDEMKEFEKALRSEVPKYKNGKINPSYAIAYSKKMAEVYNKNVGDLFVQTNSGLSNTVKFVSNRTGGGVTTVLAPYGIDMSQYKNGLLKSGKVGYRDEHARQISTDR